MPSRLVSRTSSPFEVAVAAERHRRDAAAGERRRQPGAQQRSLADARRPHEGDDARLAREQLIEQRDLVGAAEEGLGAPLVKRQEGAEKAAGGAPASVIRL